MLAKNILRFSTFNYLQPRTLSVLPFGCFSTKENEAIKRMIKNQSPSSHEISEREQKARGYKQVYMGKGPQAIAERRRLQHDYLEIQKEKKQALPKIFESQQGELTVEFKLYMQHYDPESQLIDAILNYYQIAYTRNDNMLYLDNFQSIHSKNIKDFRFPAMQVLIGLEPEVVVNGAKEIEDYLAKMHFILHRFHAHNSAFEKQTSDWIKETVRPNLDRLFWSPILTYENLFKGSQDTYRGNQRSYMILRALRLLFQNVAVNVFRNYINIFKHSAEYRKSRVTVLENFEEWSTRLGLKLFHGGEEPDVADFEMYALIKSKYQSRSFRNFVENKCPDKFYRWFVRMQLKCVYDPERMTFIQ